MIKQYETCSKTPYEVDADLINESRDDGYLGKVYVRGRLDDFSVPYGDVIEDHVLEMLGIPTELEFCDMFPNPSHGIVYEYDAYVPAADDVGT